MKTLIRRLEKIEDAVLIMMFMAMVAVIFLQVIMRFVFNNSLVWSEELGKFLFVWLSWIGISIGHRRKEHIKITLFVDKFPLRYRFLFEAITELVLILICAVTVYYSVVMIGIQANVPYAGIKISTSWGYLSLVLGCSMMLIRCVVSLIDNVQKFIGYDAAIEGGEEQ